MTAGISPYLSYAATRGEDIDLILYTRDLDAMLPVSYLEVNRVYPFIGAMSVTAPKSSVPELAELPGVSYITAEAKAAALMDIAGKVVNRESSGFAEVKGRGTTLAVIDTGIYPHFDFVHPRVRVKCFVDLLNGREQPYDDNGHGTAVAGAAAGGGYLSGGMYRGVAPEADIVAVKCMDADGISSAGSVLAAMQWVNDNRKKYGIKVCCMSFGAVDLGYKDPFRMGATALWNSGITVVAAAGNGGDSPGSIKSPGTAAKIITVGALDDNRTVEFIDDAIPPFSGRGPAGGLHKPDVVAPGVGIRTDSSLPVTGKFYSNISGTSISAGIVAGLALLLHEKYEGITPDACKSYLMKNARSVSGRPDAEGSGAVLL